MVADREVFDMKASSSVSMFVHWQSELSFDNSYLDRELGVGFSGGEKKKA